MLYEEAMIEPVVQSALVEPLLEREVRVAALEALAEASQQFNKQLVSDVRTLFYFDF